MGEGGTSPIGVKLRKRLSYSAPSQSLLLLSSSVPSGRSPRRKRTQLIIPFLNDDVALFRRSGRAKRNPTRDDYVYPVQINAECAFGILRVSLRSTHRRQFKSININPLWQCLQSRMDVMFIENVIQPLFSPVGT